MAQSKLLSKLKLNDGQKRLVSCIFGGLAGLINGLFGGGGGMVIVPVLTILLSVSPKKAHATALLVILPLSIVSTIFYSALSNMDFSLSLPVGIGVTVGGVVGAFLLSKISSRWLVIIFSLLMAFAGGKMLFF